MWSFSSQYGWRDTQRCNDIVDELIGMATEKRREERKCVGRRPVDLFSFLRHIGPNTPVASFLGQSAHAVAEVVVDPDSMDSEDFKILKREVPALSKRMGLMMGNMAGGTGEVELELTVPWIFWPDGDELKPLSARPDAVVKGAGGNVAVEFFTTYGESGDRGRLKELLFRDNLAVSMILFWKTPLSRRKIIQAYLQGLAVWKLMGCDAVEVINASTPPGDHRTISVIRGARIKIPFDPEIAFRLAAAVAWQSGVVESGAVSVKLNQAGCDFDALVNKMAENAANGDPLSGATASKKWHGARVRKVGPVEIEPEQFVGGKGNIDEEGATRNVSWRGFGPYRVTVEPVAGLNAKYGKRTVKKLNDAWLGRDAVRDWKKRDLVGVDYNGTVYDGEITKVTYRMNTLTSVRVDFNDSNTFTILKTPAELATLTLKEPA